MKNRTNGFAIEIDFEAEETVIGQDLYNKETEEWEYSEIRLSWDEVELFCSMLLGDENV